MHCKKRSPIQWFTTPKERTHTRSNQHRGRDSPCNRLEPRCRQAHINPLKDWQKHCASSRSALLLEIIKPTLTLYVWAFVWERGKLGQTQSVVRLDHVQYLHIHLHATHPHALRQSRDLPTLEIWLSSQSSHCTEKMGFHQKAKMNPWEIYDLFCLSRSDCLGLYLSVSLSSPVQRLHNPHQLFSGGLWVSSGKPITDGVLC